MEIPVNNKQVLTVTLKNGYLSYGNVQLDESELVSLYNVLNYARPKGLRFDDLQYFAHFNSLRMG